MPNVAVTSDSLTVKMVSLTPIDSIYANIGEPNNPTPYSNFTVNRDFTDTGNVVYVNGSLTPYIVYSNTDGIPLVTSNVTPANQQSWYIG